MEPQQTSRKHSSR